MGLDMYLTKKTRFYKPQDIKIVGKGTKGIKTEKINCIEEDVGYWRKANHIHKWFVDNVQDGNDNCKEYYVSRENLIELQDVVDEVLKNSKLIKGEVCNGYTFSPTGEKIPEMVKGKIIEDPTVAKRLLPTEEGFFFGNTDYNEYYLSDLKDTKKILKQILKDKDSGEYYYQSSW